MKKDKELKLAKLECIESVVIFGRNSDGSADICFTEGKDYLFCYDEKKGDIFTYNDVKEVHFLSLSDDYTDKHFKIILIDNAENFGLDEFNLARMKRLFRERYDFSG